MVRTGYFHCRGLGSIPGQKTKILQTMWHGQKSFLKNTEKQCSIAFYSYLLWRRQWHPTSVLLPGKSHGQGSLVGCRSMGSHRVGHDWSDLAAAAAAYLLSSNLIKGLLGGSDGKESACSVGDPGSIPGSGRSPGEGNGNPPQSVGSQTVRHNWETSRNKANLIKVLAREYQNGWVNWSHGKNM